jgi:uncharacterized protein YciI
MSETNSPNATTKTRYVVIHSPGPGWKSGLDFREQPGVQEHVAHFHQLLEEGKLELGGPFLIPDSGGMMVTTKDVSYDDLVAFADADPAVQSGLLRFEIRPWYTAMERDA